MIRNTLSQMIAFQLSLFTAAQAAIVQRPPQAALSKLPIEITRLRYKELKDVPSARWLSFHLWSYQFN